MKEVHMDPLACMKGPGLVERLGASFGLQRPLQCVQVEITSFCGGKCGYCPRSAWEDKWASRHMSAECFARIWPLLRRSARAHLQGWGEPMLHPRLADFISTALRAGCRVSSTSCGLAINRRSAAALAGSGLDMLAISLAGTDEASNAIRNGVPFGRVCEAIGLLNAAIAETGSDMEIHLAYLLLADRMEAAAELPGLMRRLHVPVAVVSTLDFMARPEHRALALAPGDGPGLDRARKILGLAAARAADEGMAIHYALPGPGVHPASCREEAHNSVYVNAAGLVSPCVYLNVPGMDEQKRIIFGDVTQRDAWEICNSESFAAFRRGFASGDCAAACAACVKRHESEA